MVSDARSTSQTLGVGALAGGGAYLVGYFLTYVVTNETIRDSFARRLLEFVAEAPGTWKLVGWVFYSAHYVETPLPGLFGSSRTVNFVTSVDSIPTFLFLVPPVVLLAAGAFVSRWGRATGLRDGATAGASVALGYFPFALVGAFLFVVHIGDVTARPDLITAAILAGVVYPVVFGALGGSAASSSSQSAPSSQSTRGN